MRKFRFFYVAVCGLVCGLSACVQDESVRPESPSRQARLSVEEARAFFETSTLPLLTRSAAAVPEGVFAMGGVSPDWTRAEPSSNARLACVDVPAETECGVRILQRRTDGTFFEVPVYGKLLVVKSADTDSLATYMRLLVPDELYATFYDGDLSDLFANCDDREDYSGLELYTTMDGAVAAAARYVDGKLTQEVFMGDKQLSRFERLYRLRNLLRGVYIRRILRTSTRGGEDWDFHGKDCFYDSTGALYYVVRINNIEYATMDFDGTMGGCNSDGTIRGGRGGGGSSSGGFDGFLGSGGLAGGLGGLDEGLGGSGGGNGSGNGRDPNGNDRGAPKRDDPNPDPAPNPYFHDLPVNPLPNPPIHTCPVCGKSPCICVKEVDCEELAPEAGNNSVKTTDL